MNIEQITSLIKDVPDFPKPGVMFKDITPILGDAEAFQSLAKLFAEAIPSDVNKIVAIESRGFILGAALCQHRPLHLELARKPKKLPRDTYSFTYDLEYGSDTLEIHKDALEKGDKVMIIDDVLATGGTAHAVEQLVEMTGAEVVGFRFLMEIGVLQGGKKLKSPYEAFIQV